MVDGALLLDKPVGLTSNAALQKAKKALRAAKAGHAGTLDPLASGLLIVLFGEATKFAGPLLDADKEYVATLKLGERTTTGDAEGEVIQTRPVSIEGLDPVMLTQGKEVPGKDALSAVHGGLKYFFSTADTKGAFEKNPEQYAVQLVNAVPQDRIDVLGLIDGRPDHVVAEPIGLQVQHPLAESLRPDRSPVMRHVRR